MALMLVLGSASSADAYVYWGNAGSGGLIGRANLDGSAVNTSFIASGRAEELAVDALAPDTTAPVLSLSGKTTQKAGRSVTVVVFCPAEACTAAATGTVNVPGARSFRLGGTAANAIAQGSRATLRLTISRKAQKAITRALRRGRKVTAKITVTARDAVGNTATGRRAIRLRK